MAEKAVMALTNAQIRAKTTDELKQMLSASEGELYKAVLAEYTARKASEKTADTVALDTPEVDAQGFMAAMRSVPVMVRATTKGGLAEKTVAARLVSFLGIDDGLARSAVEQAVRRGLVARSDKGRLSPGEVVA